MGDLFVGIIALVISLVSWAANADWLGFSLAFLSERVSPWFYLLPLVWLLLLVDLYNVHNAANWRKTVRGVVISTLMEFIAYSFIYIFSDPGSLPRRGVAAFMISVLVLTLIWRYIYIRVFTAPKFMRRVLLVGAGKAGETILRVINSQNPKPFQLIGVIDDDPQKIGTPIGGFSVLTQSEHLLDIVNDEDITDIIVAISGEMRGNTFQTLLDAQERGVEIIRMPVVYEELTSRVPIKILETDWLLRSFVDETRVSSFYNLGKRILDIFGGLMGIFLLILILPFIGLATLLDDGWPIFYLQTRLGKGGHPYQIIQVPNHG